VVIRAAGGVIVRDGRVLVVHRARHEDWSLPKGKLDEGDTWEAAAVREVAEETGLRARIEESLGSTHYEVGDGPKEVRWFRMTADGEARAQNEVDEVRWVPLDDAAELLTYERDVELLSRLR
jgi:8-oxo-dGTP diphosphatase